MNQRSNSRNGSGKGIDFVDFPTADVNDTSTLPDFDQGFARGVRSTVDGTLNVKLTGQVANVVIPVLAGVKEMYDIEKIFVSGGTITPDGSNVMLFW